MKNFWLKKKADKKEKQAAEQRRIDSLRRTAISNALGKPKKPCGCKGTAAKFIAEAQECAKRWEESGLLEGIKNKNLRQVTACLIESQRLWNEQKYNLKTRTQKTQYRHGFSTLEELYRYIDMLGDDMKHYVTFSKTGDCEPADSQEMVLTIYENTFTEDWGKPTSKVLCPKSAGGDWDGYDNHRESLGMSRIL